MVHCFLGLFLCKDSHNLIQFKCQICCKEFSSEHFLKKHMEVHHLDAVLNSVPSASSHSIQLWPCNNCSAMFSNQLGKNVMF